MTHENNNIISEAQKRLIPVEQTTGILKNKEKLDLENQIVDTLRSLNGHMTKKEILSLVQRIEVGKWLEGLRSEIGKEKKLDNAEISDEALQDIMNLIHGIERAAESGIRELRLELGSLNESKEYKINKDIYLSSQLPWIKKIEDSKLGESVVIDILGIGVGAIDSVYVVLKFLLTLLGDMIMLPKHMIDEVKKATVH